MSNLRDFMIVLWVVMQGMSWWMPDAYGMFQVQQNKAYDEWAVKLGLWNEDE